MAYRGPVMAPLEVERSAEGERWRHFDSSVNAVSFGFVATAILISMFLVMAIFERFLRPAPSLLDSPHRRFRGRNSGLNVQHHRPGLAAGKLDFPSPKMSLYAKGVSVLMPGHDIPTFIAHPAPAPCHPERMPWPSHQAIPICGSTSNPQAV